MTKEEIEALPSGRVLKRMLIHGRHSKMRVIKPALLKVCEICLKRIKGNAVKTECGGNVNVLMSCIDCALEELNEIDD